MIESLTTQHADLPADGLITLWDQLAAQIILLIGEAGFESLYERSIFVTQSLFPWLAIDSSAARPDGRFANLRASLQAQPQVLAIGGNRQLLITLTDILASLIGEPLTKSILDSAWGTIAPMKANGDKKNES